MVYWDGDGRKDLLVGLADGTLKIFLNVNTDDDPRFDGGTALQVGQPGAKADIDVGSRATPVVVDWNDDGRKDLVVGSSDGELHVFTNEGSDTAPDFRSEQLAQEGGGVLVVPSGRSSPVVTDLDGDGRKDVLTGNTEGQLFLYGNVGTDSAPTFSGYLQVESDGVPIDLEGLARSRPFVCEWTGDGFRDVLIGAGDGLVHLYRGEGGVGIESRETRGTVQRSARLRPPYPNPFNPVITIPFEVTDPGPIDLSVYDLRGRKVGTLASGSYPEGVHRVVWRGRDGGGRDLPSGIYVIRFRDGRADERGKITLIR